MSSRTVDTTVMHALHDAFRRDLELLTVPPPGWPRTRAPRSVFAWAGPSWPTSYTTTTGSRTSSCGRSSGAVGGARPTHWPFSTPWRTSTSSSIRRWRL